MSSRRNFLDKLDQKILTLLQIDSRIPVGEIATKLNISKSTVHYRIRRLENEKIIKGYCAKVDLFKLSDDFQAIVFIRAKYGPKYSDKVSKLLSGIPGVWAIYNVLGEWDFVVLMRGENREEFVKELESKIESSGLFERTNTAVIAKIIKETDKFVLSLKENNIKSESTDLES